MWSVLTAPKASFSLSVFAAGVLVRTISSLLGSIVEKAATDARPFSADAVSDRLRDNLESMTVDLIGKGIWEHRTARLAQLQS
jgi:hypothetical protein